MLNILQCKKDKPFLSQVPEGHLCPRVLIFLFLVIDMTADKITIAKSKAYIFT